MFKIVCFVAVLAIDVNAMMEGDKMMMMTPKKEMMMVDNMMPMFPNIVDAAVATPDLSSLVEAVTAANLVSTLADPELVATVFAPTNAAFESALAALGVSFEALANDTATLTDILLYHVVPAKALSTDLICGMVLPTLGGGNLTIDLSMGVVIEGVGSSASVVTPDVTQEWEWFT
eukprot:TRINITY_DN1599_c0_g1_i1.p1 TRINITY_DN1599_c0_g1~~TRINITY_DN1599_c0_g1_i1.p1  ORF type:complete len:175 (-),score=58.63 TRINITY_DN1599_c0_g1_i1:281-805(-)